MKLVKVLISEYTSEGTSKLQWDTNASEVVPGTYFIMVRSGETTRLEKVVVK